MSHKKTEILTFLNEPLSNEVLQAMLDAVEAYGVLKGAMLYEDVDLFEQLLLIREFCRINALSGKNYSCEDILAGLYFKDEENEIYKQAITYTKCKEYTKDKLPIYRIIPASDLLRINYSLKTLNPTVLSDQLFADVHGGFAKTMNNGILKVFYGLNNKHHIFIRMAATYYLLGTKLPTYEFDLLTLDILFTTFTQGEQGFSNISIWLAKYAMLNADWGHNAANKSFERTAIKFLTYLKDEFCCICHMLRKKKLLSDDLLDRLQRDFSPIYSNQFANLLCKHLCLRNSDFIDIFHVTPMTAIKYAKLLEEQQFIMGIRQGRKKIYVNRGFISLIQE